MAMNSNILSQRQLEFIQRESCPILKEQLQRAGKEKQVSKAEMEPGTLFPTAAHTHTGPAHTLGTPLPSATVSRLPKSVEEGHWAGSEELLIFPRGKKGSYSEEERSARLST